MFDSCLCWVIFHIAKNPGDYADLHMLIFQNQTSFLHALSSK